MAKRRENIISNYFPINRKFFRHPFWKEKRTFSKAEAWLWLMAEARFEASEATELIGGKLVRWSRGQVPASIRHLADNWGWSKGKVEDFLNVLEDKMKQITRHKYAGQTIITLSNYGLYNGLGQQNGQQSGQVNSIQEGVTDETADSDQDTKADERRTVSGQRADETNKENKENKENDDDTSPSSAFGSIVSKSIEELKGDCLKDKVHFVEHVMRKHRISEYQVERALEAFNEHLLSLSERIKTVKDYRLHFQYWLPKQDLKQFRITPRRPGDGPDDVLKSIGL